MPGQSKHGIECSEFELLLSEALDRKPDGARMEQFEGHRRTCPVCGPLFADAETGQKWLHSLEEVAPPVHLVHNILAATSGIESGRLHRIAAEADRTPFSERLREAWDGFFTPLAGFVRQPRFMMSFGMIFFSFSLALSAAGVKATDAAKVDLRPRSIRHTYNDVQVRVVKYYENIRFVYEIESRVREFKRATTPAEPGEKRNENRKNNSNKTSGQPEQRQDRNYSREEDQPVLAALPDQPPAVTLTTTRRFV